MNRVTESDQCIWCGSSLPDGQTGICPVCGKRGRIKQTVVEIITLGDAQSSTAKVTPQSNACPACGTALPINHAGACPNCGALGQIRRSSTVKFIDLNEPGMVLRGGEDDRPPPLFSPSRVLLVAGAALIGFYAARWRGAFIGLAVSLIALLLYRWVQTRHEP